MASPRRSRLNPSPIVPAAKDVKPCFKRPVTRSCSNVVHALGDRDNASFPTLECSGSSEPLKKKARLAQPVVDEDLPEEPSAGLSFNINFQKHYRLLPWFSAATILHFQKVLEQFVVGDGWLYVDFKRSAKEANLDKVFHCMVTSIGDYDAEVVHYQLALTSVLDAAKIQLLAPWKKHMTFGVSTCMKRQVGGIFLINYIFSEMPRPPDSNVVRQPKLMLDSEDAIALRLFMRDVSKLPDDGMGWTVKAQVIHIYYRLRKNDFLEFTLHPVYCSPEDQHVSREDLKKRTELGHFGIWKDLRDQLLYISCQGIGKHLLKGLFSLIKSEDPCRDRPLFVTPDEDQVISEFPPKKWTNPTPRLVYDLRKERNLAVISFRIFEILKFITPINPYTPERLHRSQQEYNKNVYNDMKRSLGPDESTWTQKPKLKRPLSQKKYRISNKNRDWIGYIKGEVVNMKAGLTDEQILQKLRKGVEVNKIINMVEPSESSGDQPYEDSEDSISDASDDLNDPLMQMPVHMPTFTDDDIEQRIEIAQMRQQRRAAKKAGSKKLM